MIPAGLADLLPRRADVMTGGLNAGVQGLLAVPLVFGTQLDLGVER